MKILNKKSKEYIQKAKTRRFLPMMTLALNGKYINFSVSSVEMCGLHIGKYVHYINIGNGVWGFIVNDDQNGSVLVMANSGGSMRICDRTMVDVLREEMKVPEEDGKVNWLIEKTMSEYKGYPIWRIRDKDDKPSGTRGKGETKSSVYKGVFKIQGRENQWKAVCQRDNNRLIKNCGSEIEAALKYNEMARKLYGEDAVLNEI